MAPQLNTEKEQLKRVLILDDERYRHDAFDKMLAGVDITHCYTAVSARQALQQEQSFDLVCLDHDLGTPDNGYYVALFICQLPPESQPKAVIIHSWNISAAVRMFQLLKEAGINVTRKEFSWRM